MTVPGNPEVEASGCHKKNLPFEGRVLGHVQLYGEGGRGGGGLNIEEPRHPEISVPVSSEGAVFYLDTTRPPPQLPSTNSVIVGRSESSGSGAPGQEESGASRQALVGSCWRWEASYGSLLPMVLGRLDTNWIRRGGKGRGEHEHAGNVGGGGPGRFARGYQEGIYRSDLEGVGGEHWVTWGRVM